MRIAFFCHSLRSDWNHGNAHFLRGLITELMDRGHAVTAWEAEGSWSVQNLAAGYGTAAVESFRTAYPDLPVRVYRADSLDLEAALSDVDLAIVHEWSEPELVAAIGRERKRNRTLRLLFHDTHHRSVTDAHGISHFDLSNYDGVLAFGESVRERYREQGWANRVWTFHEAADTRIFRPMPSAVVGGDLVWIGNWGDDEREAELREFLIEPAKDLHLHATVYGVRYPERALEELASAGIEYRGWLPNYEAPAVFGSHRFTVHVPRRPYAEALPGVPTIRMFEALACGIPLISAPWNDSENLFPDGSYLKARNGAEMRSYMQALREDASVRTALSTQGRVAIEERHTCAHRARQLLDIYAELTPVSIAA